jgi:hypothetical protein
MLGDASMQKLFSGQRKHVTVHGVISSNPPVLTCADQKYQGSESPTKSFHLSS